MKTKKGNQKQNDSQEDEEMELHHEEGQTRDEFDPRGGPFHSRGGHFYQRGHPYGSRGGFFGGRGGNMAIRERMTGGCRPSRGREAGYRSGMLGPRRGMFGPRADMFGPRGGMSGSRGGLFGPRGGLGFHPFGRHAFHHGPPHHGPPDHGHPPHHGPPHHGEPPHPDAWYSHTSLSREQLKDLFENESQYRQLARQIALAFELDPNVVESCMKSYLKERNPQQDGDEVDEQTKEENEKFDAFIEHFSQALGLDPHEVANTASIFMMQDSTGHE